MKCAYGASLKWSCQHNWSTGRKMCPSATLSTTNPTWIEESSNLWLYGELTFTEWETKDTMEWYYRKTHQFQLLKTEISVFKLLNFELVHVTVVKFWVLWPPCLTLELDLLECNTNFDSAKTITPAPIHLQHTPQQPHPPYIPPTLQLPSPPTLNTHRALRQLHNTCPNPTTARPSHPP